MWKSQFWLLANVANVQETTSLKGFVKMSRDHSLALAPSSTATCISLKTYIWPLGMIRSWAHSFELHFERCACVCARQCQRARPWQSGTSCACHWDSWAPHLPHKAEMTAERRVFKSVCLCACVYQTITAFSNPLMDRLTPQLTRNSTYSCGVCAFAYNKTFKADKSVDSAVVLEEQECA